MGWADDLATGFAAGFVPAYEASTQRREARRSAEFDAMLSKVDNLQEARNEARQEVARRREAAKNLTESLGVGDTGAMFRALELYDDDTEKVIESVTSGTLKFDQQPTNAPQQAQMTEGLTQDSLIAASEGPTREAGAALDAARDAGVPESAPEQAPSTSTDEQMRDSGLVNQENITPEEDRNAVGTLLGAYDTADSRMQDYLERTGQDAESFSSDVSALRPESEYNVSIQSGSADLGNLPNMTMIQDIGKWEAAQAQLNATGLENVPEAYLENFYARGNALRQQATTDAASEYFDGITNAASASAAVAKARADGESPSVLASLESNLEEIRQQGFEPPEDANELSTRTQAAIAQGDDAEFNALVPYISVFNSGADPINVRVLPKDGSVGYTATALPVVNQDGSMQYQTLDGNTLSNPDVLVRPLSPEAVDDRKEVQTALRKDIRENNTARRDLLTFADLSYQLAQGFEANPAVGTTVAQLAGSITAVTREGVSAFNLLKDVVGDEGSITEEDANRILTREGYLEDGETLESVSNRLSIDDILAEEVQDLGEARRAFESKVVIALFRAGGLEGQTGRSLAGPTLDRMEKFLSSAKTGEQFQRNFGDYLETNYRDLERRERDLMRNPIVQNYETTYRVNPISMTQLGEVIENDDTYSRAFNYFFSPYEDRNLGTGETQTSSAPANNQSQEPSANSNTAPQQGALVTASMVQSNPSLFRFIGKRVVANTDGTIEVVE